MRVDVYERKVYESMMDYVQAGGGPRTQRCLYFPDEGVIIAYRTADQNFGHSTDRIDFISENLELLDDAQLLSKHKMLDDIVLDVISKEKQYRESEKVFLEKANKLRYLVEIGGAKFHRKRRKK